MAGDRVGGAEELEPWRRAAKERLRALTAADQYGSQRKLARAWLGDESKANQVSEWCNPDNPKFPETANLVKLRELGVSLNWLLDAGSTSDSAEWPPERRAKLSDELDAYCARSVSDRLGERAKRDFRGGSATKYDLLATARVSNETRGDFLTYLTGHLERLVDQTCDELLPLNLLDEMKKWKGRAARAELKLAKYYETQ